MGQMSPDGIRSCISTITDFDEGLFTALLGNSHWLAYPLSYEGSYAFYSHRAGYFPMKFYDGHTMAVFYLRDGRYSILRPLGRWDTTAIVRLADYLSHMSGTPVAFLKLTYDQYMDLSSVPGFKPVEETANLQDIGDDRYCQLVVNLEELVRSVEDQESVRAGLFPKTGYLRRVLRSFEKHFANSFQLVQLTEQHMADVELIIDHWKADFRARYERPEFSSSEDDRIGLVLPGSDEFLVRPYRCLLHRFAKGIDLHYDFGFVSLMADHPVGFLFLGRTSDSCAALYANLALTGCEGLPYFSLYSTLKRLREYGIEYVNLGGQEVNALRYFFTRFNPRPLAGKEERSYEGRYTPANL